jgi:hypothetical protein
VLGTAEYPWQLTATIRTGTGHSNAVLGGTVTVEAVDGWFNFTDLTISHMGTGYILEFNVSYPVQAESFLIASSEFDVPGRTVQLHIHDQSSGDIVSGSSFSITLDLQDANTEEIISDIAWRVCKYHIISLYHEVPFKLSIDCSKINTDTMFLVFLDMCTG